MKTKTFSIRYLYLKSSKKSWKIGSIKVISPAMTVLEGIKEWPHPPLLNPWLWSRLPDTQPCFSLPFCLSECPRMALLVSPKIHVMSPFNSPVLYLLDFVLYLKLVSLYHEGPYWKLYTFKYQSDNSLLRFRSWGK